MLEYAVYGFRDYVNFPRKFRELTDISESEIQEEKE